MFIRFERRIKPKAVVDLIPMIDIVFQLVIFFMVATTLKTTTGKEVQVPDSKVVTEISAISLEIKIFDENTIYINEQKTNLENFHIDLKQIKVETEIVKQSVVIYGNKSMNYQLLIDIMDILNIEGFESIDLALNQKK